MEETITDTTQKLYAALEELETLKEVKKVLKKANQEESGKTATDVEFDNTPDEFKCPVCFEVFRDKVLQCTNGHCICDLCLEFLKVCPECRLGLAGNLVRNRLAESLIDTWKVKCPFKDNGCPERIRWKEVSSHMELCTFGQTETGTRLRTVNREIQEKKEDIRELQRKLREQSEEARFTIRDVELRSLRRQDRIRQRRTTPRAYQYAMEAERRQLLSDLMRHQGHPVYIPARTPEWTSGIEEGCKNLCACAFLILCFPLCIVFAWGYVAWKIGRWMLGW